MFMTLAFQEILKAVVDAALWCLAGLLGSLQTAVNVHTDVPWYQCLVGSLVVAAPVILIDVFIMDRIKAVKRRKAGENTGD
ncbi:MAG: hypothetical protein V1761_03570 [bacterium]